MTLEDQVVSLDLSKRLKELGVKQESYAFWCSRKNEREVPLAGFELGAWNSIHHGNEQRSRVASAFTVAELGEMLPENYGSFKDHFGYWAFEKQDTEEAGYTPVNFTKMFIGKAEADARAKMLVSLLENNLIAWIKKQ